MPQNASCMDENQNAMKKLNNIHWLQECAWIKKTHTHLHTQRHIERCTKMMAFWLRIDEISKSANPCVTVVVTAAAAAVAVDAQLLLPINNEPAYKVRKIGSCTRTINIQDTPYQTRNKKKKKSKKKQITFRVENNAIQKLLVTFKLTTKRTWQNIWRQQRKILSKPWFLLSIILIQFSVIFFMYQNHTFLLVALYWFYFFSFSSITFGTENFLATTKYLVLFCV